ncbi:DUF4398 domain-containing protein [Aquabacterium sp.]|uniref:DUF4398 domain-containing protein n=1 Tax=Aquabacterium sp. TaxID=1872578 RepID=UPI002CE3DEAD|nr:DUF4398 domain-containing protein [Aquabacterium sp.]HSW04581.1 DUF4398 domain-containing protein [Aquabacterium sp.]
MRPLALPVTPSLRRMPWTALAAAALVALLSACASESPPRSQLAVGQAAVDRATGPAAAEAPVELAMARDKIARANVAYANKDYALARQLAEQADADATLAEAQARSLRSDRALTAVRDSIRQLREEMARK